MGRGRYTPEQQAFYSKYLNSQAWKTRKTARIKKAGGRCEFETLRLTTSGFNPVRCTRTRYLCVHHNTYANLGAEPDRDLDVYCWFHHYIEHLLWQRCKYCLTPVLNHDEAAEKWLAAILSTMQIDLDHAGPENWLKLPNKEVFAAQLPVACPQCYRPGRDDE